MALPEHRVLEHNRNQDNGEPSAPPTGVELKVLPMRDHHDAVSRGDAEERHEADQRSHVVRLPRASAHLIEEARDRKTEILGLTSLACKQIIRVAA